MYKFLMLVILLLFLVFVDVVKDLVIKLQGFESLCGGFEQIVFDQDGCWVQEVLGIMEVVCGNCFYWYIECFYEQLVVFDGDIVWVYDVDLE